MLQQDEPDDYVVATGETHSVEEFVELAFAAAGIDDWERYVRQDERFFRPAEVDLLVGDATKARDKLGWEPEVDFPALVERMVRHDLKVETGEARPRPALTAAYGSMIGSGVEGLDERAPRRARRRRGSGPQHDGEHHQRRRATRPPAPTRPAAAGRRRGRPPRR